MSGSLPNGLMPRNGPYLRIWNRTQNRMAASNVAAAGRCIRGIIIESPLHCTVHSVETAKPDRKAGHPRRNVWRTASARIKREWRLRRVLCGIFGQARELQWAGVAQQVEHLICNQRVAGSIPVAGSRSRLSRARCADPGSTHLLPGSRSICKGWSG